MDFTYVLIAAMILLHRFLTMPSETSQSLTPTVCAARRDYGMFGPKSATALLLTLELAFASTDCQEGMAVHP